MVADQSPLLLSSMIQRNPPITPVRMLPTTIAPTIELKVKGVGGMAGKPWSSSRSARTFCYIASATVTMRTTIKNMPSMDLLPPTASLFKHDLVVGLKPN